MSLATNAALFQSVDKWLGSAACAVCTTSRKIGKLVSPGPRSEEGRRGLLFVKLAEQGSTVLAAAAIQDAVQEYGRENVYFIVFDENRFILDTLGLIPPGNVLMIHTGSFQEILITALARLRDIRRMKLLTLVDLEFFSRSTAAFSFLTGIPRRVGFHSYFGEGPWRGNLFTHRPRYNPHIHTSDTFRSLVAAAKTDGAAFPTFNWSPKSAGKPLPRFQAKPEETANMQKLVRERTGGTHSALVLLNANASDLLPLRRWDNENYVALAKRILAISPDYYVGFTGGPSEAGKITELVRQVGSDRAFCTAGMTTLRELLALYQISDVLITNDSGPAHFAALTDISTVVLFGPETPLLFGSLSPISHSITAGLACSPCVSALNNRQTSCKDNVCMKSITVDMVLAATLTALQRRPAVASETAG